MVAPLADLLRAWAAGSPSAGEELVRLLLPGIYGLCMRILDNDADAQEVSQETFARLVDHVRRAGPLDDVRKWTATVAMNLSFDVRRRRGRETAIEPDARPAPAAPIDDVDAETMRQAIRELPDRYRAVLHQHFVLDLKPREIAAVMGLEPGAARVLLHRALAALRAKCTHEQPSR